MDIITNVMIKLKHKAKKHQKLENAPGPAIKWYSCISPRSVTWKVLSNKKKGKLINWF